MVKDAHPEPVKEAASTVLPVWLEAFRVLLNIDPRKDVESVANWDGLAIRTQVIKVRILPTLPPSSLRNWCPQTLDIIHTAFPRTIAPYLPDFLTASLGQLHVLFPAFHQFYVLASDTVPLSSEDEKIELSQLASATLDFIAAVSRSGKARDWFNEANVNELVGDVFRWTEMTADEVSYLIIYAPYELIRLHNISLQEAEWASDANAFVAQESEDSTSYSVRVASCDLLDVLIDRFPSRVLPAIQTNLNAVIAQSSEANRTNANEWWRPLEAAFAAFGAVSQTALEVLEDEKVAGRQGSLDLTQLLVSVVPGILTQSRTFLSFFGARID